MVFYLLLARPQTEHERLRQKRFENYKKQPLEFVFDKSFTGKLSQFGLNPDRRTPTGIKAAIIREKEPMANAKWPTCSIWQDLM